MYVEKVTNLLSKTVESIIGSTDSLDLLRVYSILYLEGRQPRTCSNSQRRYFSELSINGLKKAKEMDEAKNRTCLPAWGKGCTNNNGLKFIHSECRHYSSLYITDSQAIELLNNGGLLESDFIKLPQGYKQAETIEEAVIEPKQPALSKKKQGRPKK